MAIVMHCVERSASITSLFGRGLAGWAKEERRPRRHHQQQSRGGQDRISGGAWVNKELHKPHSARPPGRAIGEIEREGECNVQTFIPFRASAACLLPPRPRSLASSSTRARGVPITGQWTCTSWMHSITSSLQSRGCNPFIKMHMFRYIFKMTQVTLNDCNTYGVFFNPDYTGL